MKAHTLALRSPRGSSRPLVSLAKGALWASCALLAASSAAALPQAPSGSVLAASKISSRYGGFDQPLDNTDQLGRSIALLGDVDGDGVADLATSGHCDDDGGVDTGAVYILFLKPDGSVRHASKISMLSGGFVGPLHDSDQMGRSLAALGDLDGDGVPDVAAGASLDDDGGPDRGAIWILFLNPDGSVKRETKLSSLAGVVGLDNRDHFGRALAGLGDVDGDGVPDLAAAAPYDDDGGGNRGAFYRLLLRPDGTIKAQQKVSLRSGGFTGPLDGGDLFGFSLARLADLDGDGLDELAVGTVGDDDGGTNAGAVWILSLDLAGKVRWQRKISVLSGGFGGFLEAGDQFGVSVAGLGDLDGDGVSELAVGAVKDDDGGRDIGAAWILFLAADGSVTGQTKISALEGGFPLRLRNWDWFGSALCALGDRDGDGAVDLAIGARMDDDGGMNRGAVYLVSLAGGARAFLTAGGGTAPHLGSCAGPEPLLVDRDEPGEALSLLAGRAAPGARLTLSLDRSELPADAELWLVVAPELNLDTGLTGGLQLDLRRIVTLRRFAPRSFGERLTLDLPASLRPGATLRLQGLWRAARTQELGWLDALELPAPR